MNLAHEHEQRPAFGMWFCDCHGCAVQLRALAEADPHAPIVIKTSMTRERITARQAARTWSEGRGLLDALTLAPGDYVREVFVGAPAPERIPQ